MGPTAKINNLALALGILIVQIGEAKNKDRGDLQPTWQTVSLGAVVKILGSYKRDNMELRFKKAIEDNNLIPAIVPQETNSHVSHEWSSRETNFQFDIRQFETGSDVMFYKIGLSHKKSNSTRVQLGVGLQVSICRGGKVAAISLEQSIPGAPTELAFIVDRGNSFDFIKSDLRTPFTNSAWSNDCETFAFETLTCFSHCSEKDTAASNIVSLKALKLN